MLKNIFAFNWNEIATESLCKKLECAVGIEDGPIDKVFSYVRRILSLVGGLPLSQDELSANECMILGERLLLEAFRHTLHTLSFHWERRGYILQESHVIDANRVDVNSADSSTLAALPGIGIKLAELIIEERLSCGMFLSIEDVEKRVKGFGESLTDKLRNVLFCETLSESWHVLSYNATNLSDCLCLLLSLIHQSDMHAKLLRALEIVVNACISIPHPSVVAKRLRIFKEHSSALHIANELTVLSGASYYYETLDRIRAAKKSISVCMFHIAMADEKHPTRKLIEALIEAHERNVEVRVLVDKDNKTDPYHSEIINQQALDLLNKHAVLCRTDASDRLLHSKFLVIDDTLVIIGSHNWSAGSYFQFDDTSMLITSVEFTEIMSKRFQEIWDKAVI